jgi:hypothetical protein
VCPGETDCSRFEGARGENRVQKERNACTGCDLFPTKKRGGLAAAKSLQRLVNDAFVLRRRRDSGYPLAYDRMSWIGFEVMLMADAYVEAKERMLRINVNRILMAAFNVEQR